MQKYCRCLSAGAVAGKKAMDCPKCIGKLETVNVEGIEIERCFVCRGLWFDYGELGKVLEASRQKSCQISLGGEAFEGVYMKDSVMLNAKYGFCPVCLDEPMLESIEEQSGIMINYCPKMHGVWLDGGKIALMLKNKKSLFFNIKEIFKYVFSLNIFKR